jgi:ribosome-binding ATPase YchF (GTP1/OBG family)
MKTIIIGSTQAGQQQLFSILTGIPIENIQLKPMDIQQGICEVKDPRIAKLSEMYKPKKTAYARIEYILLPDFTTQGPAKELIFNQLKNADEICWVTRDQADVNNFVSELVINDLILVEKRIENIEKGQRHKYLEQNEKEKEFLLLCKGELDQSKSLQFMQFSYDQLKIVRAYQFLSMKPLIIVINVTEDKIREKTVSQFDAFPSIQVSAELEAEIGQLNDADRIAFMQEMGIDEPALDKMTRLAYSGLGLISFFTVGEDEVRAWPVRKGATAAEAGSVIHSDIEKGFVRAELMKYDELVAAGSEAKLKEQGKFHLKGRDYIVEDGDILSFRFNV